MLLTALKDAASGKATKYFNQILKESKYKTVATRKMNQEIREFSREAHQQAMEDQTTPILSSKSIKQKQMLRREKQQQAAKKKTVPYVPGTVSLQVLGAGANGAPSAVYLFTDQSRYLFNCGEGTQRLAHEHKTKLSRLEQIFVTRNTWATVGGFPGLALTVQDAGVKELAIHGPPHLDSILHSMKRFVVLKALQVKTLDCTQLHDFEDQVMTVKCVPLYKTETKASISKDTDINEIAEENVVIAYICKLKPRAGTLNLEKCVERGVPPGPLLGLLKSGIDITLTNGTLVKSEDVSEPGETALSFVFLDIPTEEFLPALQAQATLFYNRQQQESEEHEVALVVHFSSEDVVNNNCYKDFMQKFSPRTQHIYLNKQNSFSGYIAAHRIQYQLNQLNGKVFPLLGESEHLCNSLSSKLKKTKLEDVQNYKIMSESQEEQKNEEVECVQSLTTYHMRPRKGLDHTQDAKLNPSEYLQETQILEDFPACLKKLKTSMLTQSTQTYTFPKITFLGTGSCIPNKTRNVSAILLQPAESSFILLDCGEGTLGQIIRFFGKAKAEEVVRHLNAIYISHLHADHHIGLIGIINERQRLLGAEHKKLLLFAPKQIQSWLYFYNERIQYINNAYELIGNGEMLQNPYVALSEGAGVREISTCLVRHCPHSFGVSLTLEAEHNAQPVKITYSGDSMPCQDLIDLGRNSTILIHEATMEDDLFEEANTKMHSTISQAIAQGREMQAEHIILTHFSQRYAKLPRMQQLGSEEAKAEAMKNVAIAFDNMQVSLEDLQHFHILYPALNSLFAEHADGLEQKALKRELKLERKRKLLNVN